MLPQNRAVKELAQYKLDEEIRAFVTNEAAIAGVTESDIATLAIGLLAHWRTESSDGSDVLLHASNRISSDIVLFATTVPETLSLAVRGLVDNAASTWELSVTGPDESSRHLRVVR